MRRLIAISTLLFAWICANGAIWDAMQVLAWTKMFADYSRTMPVADALRETFDASKPCDICTTVAQGRASAEQQLPTSRGDSAKIVLVVQTAEPIVHRSEPAPWPVQVASVGTTRREPVPVPPPRV